MWTLIIQLSFYSIFALLLGILYENDIITVTTLQVIAVGWIILFICIPFIIKNCYSIQRSLVFFNFANVFGNASDPASNDMEGTRNFYLRTENNVCLGLWHVLPYDILRNVSNDQLTDEFFELSLGEAENVVLYNHGNGGSRATAHRIDMYKVLQEHFHVITFDYRGYGDSSSIPPSQQGVVNDTMFVIEWILSKVPKECNFFIWGHSLGASITLNAASILKQKEIIPTGIVLESPFNNLRDEINEFPLAKIFKHLPWFHYTIVEPVISNGFVFQSDRYILNVDCSILILHAKDDRIIPVQLGRKLFETANTYRVQPQGSVQIIEFDSKYKYGHKFICRATDIHEIIKNFTSLAIGERKLFDETFNNLR